MTSTFTYRVRDSAGKVVEGKLEGADEALVVRKLREMGYTPITVTRRDSSRLQSDIKIPGLSGRVALKDVAVLSRQFATMINSGLSLLRALSILSEQTENAALARMIGEVRQDVERGSSLSASLARHPKAFNRLYISMVRSGEVGGSLDAVLMRLADTIESQVELHRKVKSAMTYPVVVFSLVVFIASAMLLFIVPQFKGIYVELGGTLPLPTRILISISDVVKKYFPVLILLSGVGGWFLRRWARSPKGRPTWDAFVLKVPVFGLLARKGALARFARTLAALTRSGVGILEALEIVADTAGNEVVALALRDTQRAVKQGDTLARPLSQHEVFPPMVVQMIAVGEETGALDDMLDKIADFYDQEVEATVDALTSLIEPLLIVTMGVLVGGMIISLYLPMFRIITLIK
ncbi:type II secretory pathway, component PulF [Actinobacteria bacterium IMCC26256]|nr:type II secretory pathway, component PulF [Actinobacteria bacterium IMCC26256]